MNIRITKTALEKIQLINYVIRDELKLCAEYPFFLLNRDSDNDEVIRDIRVAYYPEDGPRIAPARLFDLDYALLLENVPIGWRSLGLGHSHAECDVVQYRDFKGMHSFTDREDYSSFEADFNFAFEHETLKASLGVRKPFDELSFMQVIVGNPIIESDVASLRKGIDYYAEMRTGNDPESSRLHTNLSLEVIAEKNDITFDRDELMHQLGHLIYNGRYLRDLEGYNSIEAYQNVDNKPMLMQVGPAVAEPPQPQDGTVPVSTLISDICEVLDSAHANDGNMNRPANVGSDEGGAVNAYNRTTGPEQEDDRAYLRQPQPRQQELWRHIPLEKTNDDTQIDTQIPLEGIPTIAQAYGLSRPDHDALQNGENAIENGYAAEVMNGKAFLSVPELVESYNRIQGCPSDWIREQVRNPVLKAMLEDERVASFFGRVNEGKIGLKEYKDHGIIDSDGSSCTLETFNNGCYRMVNKDLIT